MKDLEKLKGQIEALKTTCDQMRKQIEIQSRTIELLGQYIVEPESLHPSNAFRTESNNSDLPPACLDGKRVNYIKPEDMVKGEWYIGETIEKNDWLFKFAEILNANVYYYKCADLDFSSGVNVGIIHHKAGLCKIKQIKNLRPATQDEILKYFPEEIECNTHGANDKAYIDAVTDPQL